MQDSKPPNSSNLLYAIPNMPVRKRAGDPPVSAASAEAEATSPVGYAAHPQGQPLVGAEPSIGSTTSTKQLFRYPEAEPTRVQSHCAGPLQTSPLQSTPGSSHEHIA